VAEQDWVDQIYNTTYWSDGYFSVDGSAAHKGELNVVAPNGRLSLARLASSLQARGHSLPTLIRFDHILTDRVEQMCQAFAKARAKEQYQGRYYCVYPIKVNQQRWVVEQICKAHDPKNEHFVGLEAGSKPELMACLALTPQQFSVLICNGYKDEEYVRLALTGQRLGLNVFLVVEKLDELSMILKVAQELAVQPKLGLRVRLDTIGKGQWQNTGGEKAKFGLTARHILLACEQLVAADQLDCLELLHFHMGSQVSSAKDIQRCVAEAAQVWHGVRQLGAPLMYLDVGGGLGVDYEGSQSRSTFSINYSVSEYAQVVVHAIAAACRQHQGPEPHIITESGRNLTAHHACILLPVVALESPVAIQPQTPAIEVGVVFDLWQCVQRVQAGLAPRECSEIFSQIDYCFTEVKHSFALGSLSLAEKAQAESYYYYALAGVRASLDGNVRYHRQLLDDIHERLAEKIFLNFSIFQSIPDKWGIGQIFPILPVQGLHHVSGQRRGKIQDMTCDSDGQIDWYVDGLGVEATFPMPDELAPGDVLGIFLVGAYQEILGDMHNLFGDTHSLNIRVTGEQAFEILDVQAGDQIADVLKYVNYDAGFLKAQLRLRCEQAQVSATEREQYEMYLVQCLSSYVYLGNA